METNNNQGLFKIAIGVLIGIVALLTYLFMGARNETFELQQSLTTKVEQLSTAQIKLDSISTVLNVKIDEIKKLGGDVAELEDVKLRLEGDKKKLKSDLNFSVQKYDSMIKEYEAFLEIKDDEITRLKSENGDLVARAKLLEEEKEKVISENTGLKSEKATLSKTVSDFSSQNDELKQKVSIAKAMKAINVQVAALASNGKVREGSSFKASKIGKLKISFIMPSNPVAEKNTKDIFVRILDQNGAVISEDGSAGTLSFDGKELGYSFKQGVLFENNDQKVDIVYGKSSQYQVGKYAIELYSEGFKIGNGSFEVK
jgi:predicted nuclease with TOPRIM domain